MRRFRTEQVNFLEDNANLSKLELIVAPTTFRKNYKKSPLLFRTTFSSQVKVISFNYSRLQPALTSFPQEYYK